MQDIAGVVYDGQRRGPDPEYAGRSDLQIRLGRPMAGEAHDRTRLYLSVSQNRGPLAGQVSGEFPNVTMHFFAFTLNWGSQGVRMGPGGGVQPNG